MSVEAKVAALQALHEFGKLTAENLVSDAMDPSHPCHEDFEWDDSVAAAQFRLSQARSLIGRMRVLIRSETVEVETRMFLRPPSADEYLPGDEAVSDFRDELVQQCFLQARSLVVKFRRLGIDEMRCQFEKALTDS